MRPTAKRLEAVERPDGGLALVGGPPPPWWARIDLRRWLRPRLLGPRPAAALRIECDPAGGLRAVHQSSPWQPRQTSTLERAQIRTVHLAAVGQQQGGIVIEARIEVTPDARRPPPLQFRVAGLDTQREVVTLALRIARGLDLPRYRVHGTAPAHVELLGEGSGGQGPYRGDGSQRVPPDDDALDLSGFDSSFAELSPPAPPLAPADQPLVRNRIVQWAPGQSVVVERPGRSKALTWLLMITVYGPGGLIGFVISSFVWGALIAGLPMLLLMLLYGLFPEGLDDPALGFKVCAAIGYPLGALLSLWPAVEDVIDTYFALQAGTLHLDWSQHTLIDRQGSRVTRSIPLEAIENVDVRMSQDRGSVRLQSALGEIEIGSWAGASAARSAGSDLARALGVPARVA